MVVNDVKSVSPANELRNFTDDLKVDSKQKRDDDTGIVEVENVKYIYYQCQWDTKTCIQ